MRTLHIPAAASPYMAALGTGLLIAMMIATMTLTAFERQWIVFLSGVLAAAVFAFVSHTASARWTIARRTSQLNAMRAKLATESQLRAAAERSVARLTASMQLLDAAAPALAPAAPVPVAPIPPESAAPPNVAARLVAALANDEFTLYSQAIAPLGSAGEGASFCEVLLRLNEEEDNLLPPGSFLPIAEEHGLLPAIDRWVVSHVLGAAAAAAGGDDAVYFVNLTLPTVAEGLLAAFVQAQLERHSVAGKVLCFEFPEADVLALPRAYRDLIATLGNSGCRFAVSGVGRNPASVQFLKQLRVNYLKVDGGLVLNMLRDPLELARVKALNDAAHAAGMQVVAQCVEDERTRVALQAMGTDFAQGFGISMPRPMGRTQ